MINQDDFTFRIEDVAGQFRGFRFTLEKQKKTNNKIQNKNIEQQERLYDRKNLRTMDLVIALIQAVPIKVRGFAARKRTLFITETLLRCH